jgi:predicted HicB family RNase H-like nuclease
MPPKEVSQIGEFHLFTMVRSARSASMNAMTYNGYTARIEFDERDNIFWGKVLGIQDSITFEGETVAQLSEDFHNAIDFYLSDCAASFQPVFRPQQY